MQKKMQTLSAVDFIFPMAAVLLSVAHKQRVWRTAAPTVHCGPCCEDMQYAYCRTFAVSRSNQRQSGLQSTHYVTYKPTHSRTAHRSHPGSHPDHRRVDSSPRRAQWCTRSSCLDRLMNEQVLGRERKAQKHCFASDFMGQALALQRLRWLML